MTNRHWHVANGTPGYLFDTDEPYTFDTRAEALTFARQEAEQEANERNDNTRYAYGRLPRDEHYIVTGRDRLRLGDGRDLFEGFRVMIERPHNRHDLGYVWEGWCCTDDEHDE